MIIYEHRAAVQATGGTISSDSLKISGGLLRSVFVKANTATTTFRFALIDANSATRIQYAFHTGELNDTTISLPVAGQYTAQITNASADDTFSLILGIQE